MKILALILFILMYILIIALPKWRPYCALGTAVVFLVAGILPFNEFFGVINWNVLMMIFGTMIIVDYFIASGMPGLLADFLLDKSKNVMWVTIYMSLFAGVISAFIDNVATVLMVAPVGLAICKKLKANPVPMILAIAVSSNLQGTATLVGDTTSIMLGDYANMNFLNFFWMQGKPDIFFAVELGALATIPIMMFLGRKDKAPVHISERAKVTDYFPTIMLVAMVLLLICASFVSEKIPATIQPMANGIICCALAVITIVVGLIREKKLTGLKRAIASTDYETLLMLFGLFVVIGGVTEVGIIQDFADFITGFGSKSIFLLYTIVVWGSVLISAFIDNIPYVATMLPVLTAVAAGLGVDPLLLYFGLLTGATLGGNLTPIGASANIAATSLLKKEGYIVRFKDFARIGIPFTLAAVLVGYLFIWFVFG